MPLRIRGLMGDSRSFIYPEGRLEGTLGAGLGYRGWCSTGVQGKQTGVEAQEGNSSLETRQRHHEKHRWNIETTGPWHLHHVGAPLTRYASCRTNHTYDNSHLQVDNWRLICTAEIYEISKLVTFKDIQQRRQTAVCLTNCWFWMNSSWDARKRHL